MSADLQAVADKLGKFWRVSRKGTSVTRIYERCYIFVGRRGGGWYAGVAVVTAYQTDVKAPAPRFAPTTFASPEDAALAAQRAAERWDASKRYWQAIEAERVQWERKLDDEWIARSVRDEDFEVAE